MKEMTNLVIGNEPFEIVDEKARNEISKESQGIINICNYSKDDNKTQAITEILGLNKKVMIPDGEAIKADDSSFIKENFEKFLKSGSYNTTNVMENQNNQIQYRKIKENPSPIYRDMVHPSEAVNSIKWNHQKQSWLWGYVKDFINGYTHIVPWFQFFKNPNYAGDVPNSFNIFIGNVEVLAYDLRRNHFERVYYGSIEHCAYFNYYEGATDDSSSDPIGWGAMVDDKYRKYTINKSDIENKVLHGWLGMSDAYVPANSNYKHLVIRIQAYTDAPSGYLLTNLGLDLKGNGTVQEMCGSRTSIVPYEPKYFYLSDINPNEYDNYNLDDVFKTTEDEILHNLNSKFNDLGFIGETPYSVKINPNSHYLVSVCSIGGGNASSCGLWMISTGTDSSKTHNIAAILGSSIAELTATGEVLTIKPSGGAWVTCSVMKL